jgi:ribosomal protein S18 acetylase RimI-like enzyme
MEIRRALEGDIPRLTALLYQVGRVHYDLRPDIFRPVTLKYDEAQLCDILQNDNRPVYVAVEDGTVLGFCFCIIKNIRGNSVVRDMIEFYIDDLCVDEACRGQGIAKALYAHVTDYAKSIGCAFLTLNVWCGNEGAMKFYEKAGMTPRSITMETKLC